MKLLVTGGAGYIGSHAVKRLLADGHDVHVLDNLSRGHRDALPPEANVWEMDLLDTTGITTAFKQHGIEAVMNFAALAYVGESVEQPLLYYRNNTAGVLSLLEAMDRASVTRLVHSSTCATYGEPAEMPITEDMPQSPINPYGWSKLFVERILADYAAAKRLAGDDFAYAALRYFNVAGSAPDAAIGEDHEPETHLIPVILNTVLGKRDSITIFGTDYPTPDGTCIRDYIHVEDLIDAHVTVLHALQSGDERLYNLGTGNGLSVKQIIDAVREVTGRDFTVNTGDRRPGDPPALYADPSKIKRELGWSARITDVKPMVADAWRWFQEHPDGYAE